MESQGAPNNIIIGCSQYLKVKASRKVLDLGGGKGRDSIYLAKDGFDVTLVDKDEQRIKVALETAEKCGLKIEGIVSDVSNYLINGSYAIILCNNLLQFLTKEKAYGLIGRVQLHTANGGINVIQAFTKENPEKNFDFLLDKGELEKMYSDWKVLKSAEYMTPMEVHDDLGPHYHGLASLVARKC